MKVVVDTNVLISGIFFDGPPARILEAWLHGQLVFVVSHEILEEYFEVCERLSLRYPNIEITQILILIVQNCHIVDPLPLPEPASHDADDDMFIACALASATQTIISGDSDLLTISGYENVQIITPREFVNRHLG
ncbi:MAG: putative toxin-antitoxin system toxin component, PIN family [Nitrospira sp. SB0677_bin_15]|nr:putative toxin-antitoxin system toxin component, PIN family [Nitrospira sp. SB0667_bin_9]MYD31840.1 putative toxin-antitoxin system toxin component, PIN family [Nitrospira sp. SB0661_bin_20]MYG40257.1 putative toxin-antitoxin system toxin component, PIN family [Nitrospira sp. SB0677_bin_15]MYH01458.1 putative toxin-antitoxin system toxin component, PIN family [Nitrospira sp. SB0675_bin_23]MYJ21927.1 putative toxin-antitoxin system toxin component, PIN family [Nitrospira sp. SB0673_bin_12]